MHRPPACAAALKAQLTAADLPVLPNPSHIVPVMVGDPVQCKLLTDALLNRFGIYVQPINYPTVPRGAERIRLTPGPMHTDADMARLLSALDMLWTEMGLDRRTVWQQRWQREAEAAKLRDIRVAAGG